MFEWIVSCKKAFRLFLRRIYVNKKNYRDRSLTRPLHENEAMDGRPHRSCYTNLSLLIILTAGYLFLMTTDKKPSYSEKSIESSVLVNPNQVMKVNIPKDMRVELARKWLSRNAPTTETVSELPTTTLKSFLEQAKFAKGNVIVINDDDTTTTTTMIPIEVSVCYTRVWPEKLTLTTSGIKVPLDKLYPLVQDGGHFKPTGCVPIHTVAILVPYRNRTRNLTTFLYNIHPFLMTQNLEYRVFVIEQFGNNKFNKGRLFNAGFKEMKKYGSWRCVILHDVDLLPMDRRIFYTCPQYPRHMSSSVQGRPTWRNTSSPILFGGVTAMTLEHYEKANGHSNMYWGWGGEDYDMFWRLRAAKIPIVRYNKTIARYLALPHPLAPENPSRYSLIRSAVDRWQTEGLNTIDYKVVSVKLRHLFTHIVVNIAPWAEPNKVQEKLPSMKTDKELVKHRRKDKITSLRTDQDLAKQRRDIQDKIASMKTDKDLAKHRRDIQVKIASMKTDKELVKHRRRNILKASVSTVSLNQVPVSTKGVTFPADEIRGLQNIPPGFPMDPPPIFARWG